MGFYQLRVLFRSVRAYNGRAGNADRFSGNVYHRKSRNWAAANRAGEHRNLPIEIGAGVWIGARAVILPGVKVGDGAVIAAGAVVTKDVAANTLVVGVPARVLRELEG